MKSLTFRLPGVLILTVLLTVSCTYVPPRESMRFPNGTTAEILITGKSCPVPEAPSTPCAEVDAILHTLSTEYLRKQGFAVSTKADLDPLISSVSPEMAVLPADFLRARSGRNSADLLYVFSVSFQKRPAAEISREKSGGVPFPEILLLIWLITPGPLIPEAQVSARVAVFDARSGSLINRNSVSRLAPHFTKEGFLTAWDPLVKILLAEGPNTGSGVFYFEY